MCADVFLSIAVCGGGIDASNATVTYIYRDPPAKRRRRSIASASMLQFRPSPFLDRSEGLRRTRERSRPNCLEYKMYIRSFAEMSHQPGQICCLVWTHR